MRVVIVGGGVSGLASAAFLGARGAELTVLEAGARPGGNTATLREHGFQVDQAANGWLPEPAMDRLVQLAGLGEQRVFASDAASRRYLWADGRVWPLPTSPPAFLRSGLLGWGAKLRLAAELLVPRGGHPDETVAAFARRRLGAAAVDRLVAPMVAGVFGGDAENVALDAAFPRMVALEREQRSLILAMIRLGRGGAPSGRLGTVRGGAGALPEALAARLGERLKLGVAVTGLARRGAGWQVQTDQGAVEADAVVLAVPAYATLSLLGGLDPEAAAALAAIPYAPIAVVATGWAPESFARPPDGFGALAARERGPGAVPLGALGALYTHCVFPEQAPPGHALIRVMIGGATDPASAALDEQALAGRARGAVEHLLGAPRQGPLHTWIFRHPRGIPQYTPGHLGRVAAARAAEARLPGLFLTGNHLDGVGLKDCARAAEAVAARVMGEGSRA